MEDGMSNKRKVQLTGTSTFTVSLPKDWARRNGVESGSLLFVGEDSDGSLRVRTREESSSDKGGVQLDVKRFSSEGELQRCFLAKYLAGFSVIRFKHAGRIPAGMRKVIVSEVDRLIGLEVVEEVEGEIVVQDFFSKKGLSLDKMVKRAHMITLGMYEDAVSLFSSYDEGVADGVERMDDEVDRLNFLVLRQINLALNNSSHLRALGLRATDCLDYAKLVKCIESIADNARRIALSVKRMNKRQMDRKLAGQLEKIAFEARDEYVRALKAFFASDAKSANAIIERKRELVREVELLEEKIQSAKAAFQLSVILVSILRVCDYSVDIAELVIDRGDAPETGFLEEQPPANAQ